MELREAMAQIAEIRQQMARGHVFRGYRSATTAFSGGVAVATAAVQGALLVDPGRDVSQFLLLWVGAAAVSLAAVAVEMIVRVRRSASGVQRQLTMLAVEQFVPSVAAGAVLTYAVYAFAREAAWMLPGLWMMLFSLGVFASSRLLPRAVFGVAGFYLIAGLMAFVVSAPEQGGGAWAFSPWLMGVVFGAGQFATAAILYWKLERGHE
ncbi:MAG TPA: hypothetical protein VHQ47_07445 [Phycisphaerae bacterium]|jgi:hypothetical protein|nr:hypothetical protein [Phycisphaerae bacterium]